MAEFVMKHLAAGSNDNFWKDAVIASSATSTEEIGNGIHPGTKRILAVKGITFETRHAVQLQKSDYRKYDYFIGMDSRNVSNMMRIFGGDPEKKVRMLLDYTDHPRDIADPWYTGDFEETYQDVLEGCEGMVAHIRKG